MTFVSDTLLANAEMLDGYSPELEEKVERIEDRAVEHLRKEALWNYMPERTREYLEDAEALRSWWFFSQRGRAIPVLSMHCTVGPRKANPFSSGGNFSSPSPRRRSMYRTRKAMQVLSYSKFTGSPCPAHPVDPADHRRGTAARRAPQRQPGHEPVILGANCQEYVPAFSSFLH